ncbi:MAG: ferrous iron transporter B, partial [Clostridiaceae bacterium]|nr:ferrous iron transporter B [Clostridiaceae bacterium]
MGLTSNSTGIGALEKELKIERSTNKDKVIALSGNPNVGKSTIFNSLTGLNQHTGNWPGKTVTNAQGKYEYKDRNFILVDIPGTYSLMANSAEEEVARDFICFGNPDATIVVIDATLIERNLNLVLQTLEITSNVIVCVNLLDEAKRKKIHIELELLSNLLGVPVVGTNARKGEGLDDLMQSVYEVTVNSFTSKPINIKYDEGIENAIEELEPEVKKHLNEKLNSRWVALKLLDGDETLLLSMERYLDVDLLRNSEILLKLQEAKDILKNHGITSDVLRDKVVTRIYKIAEKLAKQVVSFENEKYDETDRKIDRILTSKVYGIPVMMLLLGVVFWITITGANYPSELISTGLFWVEDRLTDLFNLLQAPKWLHGMLVTGIYRTLAWVVSVMLPPMAIFFPLFTLLEDLGYLPRIAF